MAKIGTAHIEIKPVLNEEALDALVKRIEDAIEAGVARALDTANRGRITGISAGSSVTVWQNGKKVAGYTVRDPKGQESNDAE